VDDDWSLEELVDRAARALAADGVHPPNGRVRDLPDARSIRWYATIGLVDRPRIGHRRSGRYAARHLLQVVAIKRRQAEGRTLAEIQAELAGAPDAILSAVARVPASLLAGASAAAPPVARPRFWAAAVAPAPAGAAGAADPTDPAPAPGLAAAEAGLRAPGAPAAPAPGLAAAEAGRRAPGAPAAPAPAQAPGPADPGLAGGGRPGQPPTVSYLISLRPGVVLSLPVRPGPADLAAIHAAAAPLLALLTDRHLTAPKEPHDDDLAH
jgi:MerR HTH family regulatory protein